MTPLTMSHCANGEIGMCEILCAKTYEDCYNALETQTGNAIQILDLGNTGPSDPPANGANTDANPSYTIPSVVFDGVIYKRNISVKGDRSDVKLICYNTADDFFRRQNLHGQARKSITFEQSTFTAGPKGPMQTAKFDTDIVVTDIPLVFNPNGERNASQDTYYDTGGSSTHSNLDIHIFESPLRNQFNVAKNQIIAQAWKLSWAVKHLLVWFTTEWCISPVSIPSAIDAIETNGDPEIAEFNCEGKSLLQALTELLLPYNYFFSINPSGLAPTGSGITEPIVHEINIYFRGSGPTTKVDLSARNSNSSDGDSNLLDMEIVEDYTSVVNNLAGVAQQEIFTTVFHTNPPSLTPPIIKLVPSWDNSTGGDLKWNLDGNGHVLTGGNFASQYSNLDLAYARTVDQTGSSLTAPFQYGIGRKWIVNFGEVPWSPLEPLTTELTIENLPQANSVDPRRLEKPELFQSNKLGGQLQQMDVQVEMSTDNGTNWGIVDPTYYEVLSDQCGIQFNKQSLDDLGLSIKNSSIDSGVSYWQALHDSNLQIRIIASIKSDRRLAYVIHNAGDAFPLAIERQFENQGYRLLTYNNAINTTEMYVGAAPIKDASPDDTAGITAVVEQQYFVSNNAMTSGRFVICPIVNIMDYYPGQVITGITNRFDFDFPPTILKVLYDLTAQHVSLICDSRIVKTPLHGLPLYAQNRIDKRLGIGGEAPQSGQSLPYIAGDRASMEKYYRGGGQ